MKLCLNKVAVQRLHCSKTPRGNEQGVQISAGQRTKAQNKQKNCYKIGFLSFWNPLSFQRSIQPISPLFKEKMFYGTGSFKTPIAHFFFRPKYLLCQKVKTREVAKKCEISNFVNGQKKSHEKKNLKKRLYFFTTF